MTHSSRQPRALSRLVASAIATALVGTAAGTAAAAGQVGAKAGRREPTPVAPSFFLSGILPSGQMYAYLPDGKGGFDARSGACVRPRLKYGVSVDPDLTGHQDGAYHVVLF